MKFKTKRTKIMEYTTLNFERKGPIGILTLNRPEVINAVNMEMLSELNRFWQQMQDDFDVRVIVLKGSGEKGFCSGLDLKAAASFTKEDFTPENIYNNQRLFSGNIRLMRTCPQPIIAAMHGPVMGAGLAMACASDVRLAGDDAMFCAQYINIGTGGADMGSSYFLWKIMGWGRAAQMCLTGERIMAEDALKTGLVTGVYSRETLVDEAMNMAETMVLKSKMGLRLTKEALNGGLNMSSLEDACKMEDRNQAYLVMSGMMQTQM